MLKNVGLPAGELAASFQVIEIGVKANPAQRDYDFHVLQTLHFTIQIGSAVRQLLWKRLVVGRSTANRGRDVNIFQLQPVITISRIGLVGKSGFKQHGIHEFAGRISGKRTAGAIGAVRSGSEAKNKHPRGGVAEAGYGLSPVFAIAICATLLASNPLAIFHQARTAGAGYDLGIEFDEAVSVD